MAESRFVVGIDLGTTNSVLAAIDTQAAAGDGGRAGDGASGPADARVLPVPQLVKPGEVAARDRLPSFLYLPTATVFPAASLTLPWGRSERVVGELARARGAEVP